MNHGGIREGAGRPPLESTTTRKTVTLLKRQVDRLDGANLSEVIRRCLDEDEAKQAKLLTQIWEDNAGGLWAVDTSRQKCYKVDGAGRYYADLSSLFAFDSVDREVFLYSAIIDEQPEVNLVAEYDGETLHLYPHNMGRSAQAYCGIHDTE